MNLSQNIKNIKILSLNVFKKLTLGLSIRNVLFLNQSVNEDFNYRLNYYFEKNLRSNFNQRSKFLKHLNRKPKFKFFF